MINSHYHFVIVWITGSSQRQQDTVPVTTTTVAITTAATPRPAKKMNHDQSASFCPFEEQLLPSKDTRRASLTTVQETTHINELSRTTSITGDPACFQPKIQFGCPTPSDPQASIKLLAVNTYRRIPWLSVGDTFDGPTHEPFNP